jgi:hypothetical protein
MKEVQLNISTHQMKKLLKGVNVTLSPSSLGNGKTYSVEKKVYTKINRAIRNNKGLRINKNMLNMDDMSPEEGVMDEEMEVVGGKINFKKIINRQGVQVLEGIKKVVPKNVAKTVVGDATGMAGMAIGTALGGNPEMGKSAGKALGRSAVEGFYKTDFRDKDALKDFGQNTGQDFAKEGLKTAFSGKGLVNGINPRGMHYTNGNPNLNGKNSTDTIWNSDNLRRDDVKIGGSFLGNGERRYRGYGIESNDVKIGGSFLGNGERRYRGYGIESNDVKYHQMRSHLMRNANLPLSLQDKKIVRGSSFLPNGGK